MLYTIIKALVLPPGLFAATGLLGLLLMLRWRRLGMALLVAVVGGLWLASLPLTAGRLAAAVEPPSAVDLQDINRTGSEAIIVLGGGYYDTAAEFNDYSEVSRLTLERLRYAARLHRASGLEIAVTGGKYGDLLRSEASTMATTLEVDFGVAVRWQENRSRNTAQNARFSRDAFPFQSVVLVTHAMHMARAVRAFEDAGFEVLAAPMGFYSGHRGAPVPSDYLPDVKAFNATHYALYELFGRLWYRCCAGS